MSYRIGDMVAPALPEREALRGVIDGVRGRDREGRPALTDGRSGLRVLDVLEAAPREPGVPRGRRAAAERALTGSTVAAPAVSYGRPGLDARRLLALMSQCVDEMSIDLSGAVVLTEAATGPYVVTPVLAALAGAQEVIGVTRASRHGSVDDVRRQTAALAEAAGVADRVWVTDQHPRSLVSRADVVTNSGHVRPLDSVLVAAMKPTAVVPLMFESWEIQAGRFDVDLDALARRHIPFSGTNERHPAVDVFSHLGTMATKLIVDSATAVHGARVLVLCDNPFEPYLERGLAGAGARAVVRPDVWSVPDSFHPEVVLVALRPGPSAVLPEADVELISSRWPDALVAQFWGDLDREALERASLRYWPRTAPPPGHMGVLPSDVGPEPVVRLQAGGLKVASVLRRSPTDRSSAEQEFLDDV